MIRIDADFDYTNALVEGWNRKLRSVRIASFIISILLVVCALLCAFFPVQSAGVMGTLAAILILALGVYQLIDYFCAPPFLREAGGLVSSVLNLLIGVLLQMCIRDRCIGGYFLEKNLPVLLKSEDEKGGATAESPDRRRENRVGQSGCRGAVRLCAGHDRRGRGR